MNDFWFIRKRKFSNSSVINEFYFEEESKKGHFNWADLQVKWYKPLKQITMSAGSDALHMHKANDMNNRG